MSDLFSSQTWNSNQEIELDQQQIKKLRKTPSQPPLLISMLLNFTYWRVSCYFFSLIPWWLENILFMIIVIYICWDLLHNPAGDKFWYMVYMHWKIMWIQWFNILCPNLLHIFVIFLFYQFLRVDRISIIIDISISLVVSSFSLNI